MELDGLAAASDPSADVPIATLLIVAALGAATVRRRFSAAVFLGVAGYAMAGLFVAYGAPDLALTQAVVETLSTVVFVLVLRRLPTGSSGSRRPRRRVLRIAIAGVVGAMVFVFAIAAAGVDNHDRLAREIVDRAVPDGHGRNVVNVILVDFRGFDTLGEITVLVAASIGAVALARVGRRAARQRGEPTPRAKPVGKRLVFVDVSVQLVFHAVLMLVALVAVRRPQPTGRRLRRRAAGRVRDRAALHRRRHRRGPRAVAVPAVDRARRRPARRRGHGRAAAPHRELPCSTSMTPR